LETEGVNGSSAMLWVARVCCRLLVGGLVGHYLKARQDQMGLDDANSGIEASRRFDQRDASVAVV
jgi:hypothetical protein